MAEVVSHVKYRWYNVSTPGNQEGFYLGVFSDTAQPLCKALGGIKVEGCEDAVAATSWSMRMERKLYAADGQRKLIVCTCDIDILLPKWVTTQRHKVPEEGHDTVRRFLANTETHERGHGETCTSLINSIRVLAENMPLSIPPAEVDNYNGAFQMFAHDFYEVIARRTDDLFDTLTGHGARHGAEISRFPAQEGEVYAEMFENVLPGEETEAAATKQV